MVGDGEDSALLARLRTGDSEVFSQIVRDWSPQMLRFARSFVSGEAAAQDVVQETWVGVIQGLSRFEGRCQVRTWVFAILANQARKRGVSDHRSIPMSSLAPQRQPTVDPQRFRPPGEYWAGAWREDRAPVSWGPEAQVLSAEVADLLRAAIAGLPDRQRDVLTLRDVHGFTTEEVAEQLGLAPGNVRVLLHRARVKVRQSLEDYYRNGSAVAGHEFSSERSP